MSPTPNGGRRNEMEAAMTWLEGKEEDGEKEKRDEWKGFKVVRGRQMPSNLGSFPTPYKTTRRRSAGQDSSHSC